MSSRTVNEPDEERPGPPLIPNLDPGSVANTAHRDQNGIQSHTIYGGVIWNDMRQAEPDLINRRASPGELAEVARQFVEPGGFAEARRALNARHIVVLCGRGTGRLSAARRLLVDCGVSAVSEMNRGRGLGTVREDDLVSGSGYIWDVSGDNGRPFSDWEVEQCAGVMKVANCRLVILLEHRGQSSAPPSQTITLSAPDPIEVAQAVIRRRCPESAEAPAVVLKSELAIALEYGESPEKAVRAAELAIRVAQGELSGQQALAELSEDVKDAVSHWFEGRSILEYAMSVAVAVLAKEPYETIASHALTLDEEIRKAQLPEDKKPRPRRVFEKSKEQLLRDIRTVSDIRDHPKHAGLQEETIRFERQGWGEAVLCHVWREYSSAHAVLQEWLCGDVPTDAARYALCTIIADVPAHDPLRVVNELAGNKKWKHRSLAADILVSLADDYYLLPLVKETLRDWTEYGGAYQKWTAATVYSSSFGRRDMRLALSQLARIGKSSRQTPQEAVVAGVLGMLSDPDNRELIINAVMSWSEPMHRRTGLRTVSLTLGLWLVGLSDTRLDVVEFAESFDRQVRTLLHRVLADPDFGRIALNNLFELALGSQWDEGVAAEVVRIVKLITPDLRWWRRRRDVAELVCRHPSRRSDIHRIFRVARQCQRNQYRTGNRAGGKSTGWPIVDWRSSSAAWVRGGRFRKSS